MSIRRFFDLLLYSGIIAGTLWISYLRPTRLFDLRGLAALAAAIAIIIFSIILIFINQEVEITKAEKLIRDEQDNEHAQRVTHLESELDRARSCNDYALTLLALVSNNIAANIEPSIKDMRAVRSEIFSLIIMLLKSGASIDKLIEFIKPEAIRELFQEYIDERAINLADREEWACKLAQFVLEKKPKTNPPTTTTL